MALKWITDEHVLGSIVELTGDGYCTVTELLPLLPKRTHADRRRAVHHSVDRG